MVRHPVVAETWHLITHVRRAMLANSFSILPVFVEERWYLVTDLMVMRFLRAAANKDDRNTRLSTPLGTAIEVKDIAPVEAKCVPPETKLADLGAVMDHGLVLVSDGSTSPSRLVGILSPFDLL